MVESRIVTITSLSSWRSVILMSCALFLALMSIGSAQEGGVPGALLNYGMTPRTIAMGKTFTGLADDQEAAYYNPVTENYYDYPTPSKRRAITHGIKVGGRNCCSKYA